MHSCLCREHSQTIVQTDRQTDRQTHLPDELHEELLVVLVGEEQLVPHAHEGGAEVVQGLLPHTLVLTHDLPEDTLEGMLGEGGGCSGVVLRVLVPCFKTFRYISSRV